MGMTKRRIRPLKKEACVSWVAEEPNEEAGMWTSDGTSYSTRFVLEDPQLALSASHKATDTISQMICRNISEGQGKNIPPDAKKGYPTDYRMSACLFKYF